MTKNAIATFLTCASLIVPTAAFADPDPKPFSTNQPGLLSSWLEKNFSDMTYFCLGGQKIKLKKGWSEKDTSSIPAIIAQKLNLTKPDAPKYKSFADATLTRLFGYVYKQNDSERGGIVADPGRYLPDNYSNTDDQIAEDGLGFRYSGMISRLLASLNKFNAF